MITVYAYDSNTKEFLGTTLAQESPLEPSVILMPANSTATEPPSAGTNQKQAWNGSDWDVVADLRGTAYYDTGGKEYIMSALGELPDGALLEKPAVQEEEQERQLGQLTLSYIAKLNNNYPALNLFATDTVEEAKFKMINAGITFEESAVLLLFYRENL